MTYSLWAKASRSCAHISPSNVVRRSIPLGKTFVTLTAQHRVALSRQSTHSRHEHSLASKKAGKGDHGNPAFPTDTHSAADPDPTLPSFNTLKGIISDQTFNAITQTPFHLTTMSPVQAAVFPLLPQITQPHNPDPPPAGSPRPTRDLLVKAKTGTGKTMAFLVPAIEARLNAIEAAGKKAVADAGLKSDPNLEERAKRKFARDQVGTLVISPTRELATQIANEAKKLFYYHKDMEVRLFYGGASKRPQMNDWMKGRRDIVVSTPGRMRDMLMSEPDVANGMSKTKLLVLDEADTLLDMGFREDIEAIKEYLPPTPQRQTFLFSATVSPRIQQVARSTLDRDHVFINTVTDDSLPVHAHVQQYHTVLPNPAQQIPHILRLLAHDQLSNPGKSKTIVFLPTTKMTQLFASFLRDLAATTLPVGRSTKIYEIHSKRTQDARTNTSYVFRHDTSRASILVSSDVSARGIDYPGVTRIIQVGIPGSAEQYVHRVGRTGRAGTEGRGDLVLLPWEVGFVTWQLNEMPLKPLTVDELSSQVNDLVTKYDANPAAFAKDWQPSSRNEGKSLYQGPLVPRLEAMNQNISTFLSRVDEEAVSETFASLLGYYMPKSMELRVQKPAIVQGCKDWATESCGLPIPPYVSESFLQKLGADDRRQKPFGRGGYSSDNRRREFGVRRSWEGRGHQRSWGREPSSSRRSFADELGVKDFTRPYGKERSEADSWGSPRRSSYDRRNEGGYGEDGQSGQRYGQRESGGGFGMRGNGGNGRRDSGGFGERQSSRRDEWSGRR